VQEQDAAAHDTRKELQEEMRSDRILH